MNKLGGGNFSYFGDKQYKMGGCLISSNLEGFSPKPRRGAGEINPYQ